MHTSVSPPLHTRAVVQALRLPTTSECCAIRTARVCRHEFQEPPHQLVNLS